MPILLYAWKLRIGGGGWVEGEGVEDRAALSTMRPALSGFQYVLIQTSIKKIQRVCQKFNSRFFKLVSQVRVFDRNLFVQKILILLRGFSPRSPRVRRGFEKSPRAGAEARGPGGVPEGIFQIPERTRGIWPKIHDTKSEFCTYFFFQFVGSNPKITNPILFNFKRYNKQIVSIIASQLAYNSFFLFGRNVFYKTRLFVSQFFLLRTHLYFFELEKKRVGGSRIPSRSTFTLNRYEPFIIPNFLRSN